MSTWRSAPHDLFTCSAEWVGALADELRRGGVAAVETVAPGWLATPAADLAASDEPMSPVAFAAQLLPRALDVAVPSIQVGARDAADRVIAALAPHVGPWRLHVFCQPTPGGSASPRRCALIEAAFDQRLAAKQRRLRRARVAEPLAPWQADEALVQLALLSAQRAALSIVGPTERATLRRRLSRFPGGAVPVEHDRHAPSRAGGKLLEAELHLARAIAPGETCVDLGASPGGWTYIAAQRGARVIAVDRSPLRDDLLRSPQVAFERGDAFRYTPTTPVDWLWCDVIAFPPRIAELLDRWLAARWCRRFVVTIKLRGRELDHELEPIKRLLAASGYEHTLRRLTYNKNETTAFGCLPEA